MTFQLEFLFRLVEGTLRGFYRHVEEHVELVIQAFPNPVAMLDAVVNFFTGLPGVFVSAPFVAMEAALISRLKKAKMHNRVMTLEKAIHLAFDAHAEVARNLTFTDSSGLIGWLAGAIGRFLWSLAKNLKLLRNLIGAKTEAEAIQVVLRSLQSKANLLRVVAMVIGILLAIEWIGFLLWNIGLMLIFIEGGVNKLLLFPNRPKVRLDKPSRQYRQGRTKALPASTSA